MKKILFFLLALWVNSTAFAHDIYYEGLCYNIISTTDDIHKDVEVTYFGSLGDFHYSGEVNIPEKFIQDGILYTVKSIGDCAFDGCSSLTSITIPSSVTSIGDWAFYGCSSLTSVTIPSSVTSIGEHAFQRCASLTSVTIPSSVTRIEWEAFDFCTSLTSVSIPSSVKILGPAAFGNCSSLQSVSMSSGVDTIDVYAFGNCTALESIDIPSSVKSIGEQAFLNCKKLSEITIPSSVTSIGKLAFHSCRSLTQLFIPANVDTIGHAAFAENSKLEEVVFEEGGSSPLYLDSYVFCGDTSLVEVVLPSRLNQYQYAPTLHGIFTLCKNLKKVTLPLAKPWEHYSSLFIIESTDPSHSCFFEIPEGSAMEYIKAGFYNISDDSALPWMKGVFSQEKEDIVNFAKGMTDKNGAYAQLLETIEKASAAVEEATTYLAISEQIDVLKAAAKQFVGSVDVPAGTDLTCLVRNPYFNDETLGWHIARTGGDWNTVLNTYVVDSVCENGDVSLDKFYERWSDKVLVDSEISQTIAALPAGHYRLELDAIVASEESETRGVTLSVGSRMEKLSISSEKPQHYEASIDIYGVPKDVRIALKIASSNAKWVAIDNCKLYYEGAMQAAPDASELVSSEEDTYYIYNVETGMFLNGGNGYGTQAVLAEDGLPVRLTQDSDGYWEIYFREGSRNQQKLYQSVKDEGFVFTDYIENYGDCRWIITPLAGCYTIQSVMDEETSILLGNDPSSKDWDVLKKDSLTSHINVILTDNAANNTRWQFIKAEEYELLMAKRQLRTIILRMKKSGLDNEDLFSKGNAVYENPESTLAEVIEIATLLNSQMGMPQLGKPVDMTPLVTNPRFKDEFDAGWIGSKLVSDGNADNSQFETHEFYHTNFNMYQKIIGVPNGRYKVKYKGFYNRPNGVENYDPSDTSTVAVVYANEVKDPVMHIMAGASNTGVSSFGVDEREYNGKYVPTSQKSSRQYFDAGYYASEFEVIVTDNVLTIGVKNTQEMLSGYWVCFSDFELEILENGKAIHNKLSLQDSKGISGGKTTLKVDLNNEDTLAGVQFDVQLPAGMSFSLDGSGKPKFTKSSRLSGMTVKASLVDGKARVLVYGVGETVKGNSGNIVSLEVNISDELANGDYEVQVLNTVLTESSSLEIKPFNVSGKVTLVEAEIGDANKDGSVNVTDIISVANYILGTPSGSFDFFAADMNGDGSVNVTDIICIANFILGGSSADAKSRMPFELDPQ